MKNIAEQLIETIEFLQERRKGYKYSIHITPQRGKWIVSVTGESLEDRSYPSDFVSCSSDNFDELPALIKVKASDLLALEIRMNAKRIEEIQTQNSKLREEADRLKMLLTNN